MPVCLWISGCCAVFGSFFFAFLPVFRWFALIGWEMFGYGGREGLCVWVWAGIWVDVISVGSLLELVRAA